MQMMMADPRVAAAIIGGGGRGGRGGRMDPRMAAMMGGGRGDRGMGQRDDDMMGMDDDGLDDLADFGDR